MLRQVASTFFLVLAGTLQGCPVILTGLGATGGVAGTTYAKGELEQIHAAPYNTVWDATLNALRTMHVVVSETQKDQVSAKAVGAELDGTSVTITVLPVTRDATSVRVRVGTFGDRPASERIQGEIAVVLKSAT
ncbi:DUF3568 family protein [Candidatus Methylomirabilis sp.]|uniref:DUF3568 family protein n=1 Tax=Candidatus Methylomirabilis sp. TaxID=2032687 RepID=UPI002A68E092|nr:DUF3568 family protein [Candidatus Methylomirabilis sp.]